MSTIAQLEAEEARLEAELWRVRNRLEEERIARYQGRGEYAPKPRGCSCLGCQSGGLPCYHG